MSETTLSFDLDDPRASLIAEALANKTCKKILSILAQKEQNASELSVALKLPLNTVGYNLEKLVEAGLVEKSKGFLWSVKGKKIEHYRLVDKKIIISPKKMSVGVIPAILSAGILSLGVKLFLQSNENRLIREMDSALQYASMDRASESMGLMAKSTPMLDSSLNSATSYVPTIIQSSSDAWLWFLVGALVGMALFTIWNKKRIFG